MAVRNVMRKLAHGPALGAVGRVQLLLGKPFHGCPQIGRGLGDFVDRILFLFFCGWSIEVELADGIVEVGHFVVSESRSRSGSGFCYRDEHWTWEGSGKTALRPKENRIHPNNISVYYLN